MLGTKTHQRLMPQKNRHPFSEAALEVISWSQPSHTVWICSKNAYTIKYKLVKKEIKCSEDFKILNEIFRETTRKLEKHELIRVVSRSISCGISKFPAHLMFFNLCIHVRVYCFRHGFALEFAAEQYLSKQKLVCTMRWWQFQFLCILYRVFEKYLFFRPNATNHNLKSCVFSPLNEIRYRVRYCTLWLLTIS